MLLQSAVVDIGDLDVVIFLACLQVQRATDSRPCHLRFNLCARHLNVELLLEEGDLTRSLAAHHVHEVVIGIDEAAIEYVDMPGERPLDGSYVEVFDHDHETNGLPLP